MATEYDTAQSQYQNYRFCHDNGHDQWVKQARACFEFWAGNQWDCQTKARLALEGRPALTLNVIESLVRAMKGVQRALRNDVRFAPVYDADTESARVQDAIWLHVQSQNHLDFLETDLYEKGLIMGRAYYDVRVSYDESFQGHVQIRGRRSQDVVLDPSVDDYDSDRWPQVYTRRWVSYIDLKNLFGTEKASAVGYHKSPAWYDYEDQFMSQQMGRMPYYTFDGTPDPDMIRAYLLLDRQFFVVKSKDVFVDVATGDTSEIPETWERDRVVRVLELTPGLSVTKRRMKTVRWAVSCESTVLHDEDSPYQSFTTVPFFPTFVDGVSKGAVESLLDPQQLYNKITSQELHIINTTANSGWKVKRGSLKNMTIEELEQRGAKSGFVAELDELSNMDKITPNPVPQGHDRLSFKADQIMRSLAGVSNSGRGFARDDASGTKVLQDQAAQDVNFAGWLANLHRTKQLLAARVQDCVRAHYTETRTLLINRGSAFNPQIDTVTLNQPTPEGRVLNDVTRGRYTTVLVPAPSRASMSEEDFKLLVSLRKEIGIAIPDAMLIELSPASNKAQIIQMLQGDSNQRQRAAEETEAQQQQIEQQLALAKARKEEAAALLNQARAEKAAIEAAADPDAAYERVEMARIDAARDAAVASEALSRDQLQVTKQHQDRQIALRLAELDLERDSAQAEVADPRRMRRRGNKPGNAMTGAT